MISVPISNSTKVCELPSLAVDWIEFTPLIERSALSTRWVIWFSISVGAAPGWEILTITAGNSTSGLLVTSMRMKLTSPATSSAVNATSGITGLRIDQAERFLKFMRSCLFPVSLARPCVQSITCEVLRWTTPVSALFAARLDGFTRVEESAGLLDDEFLA